MYILKVMIYFVSSIYLQQWAWYHQQNNKPTQKLKNNIQLLFLSIFQVFILKPLFGLDKAPIPLIRLSLQWNKKMIEFSNFNRWTLINQKLTKNMALFSSVLQKLAILSRKMISIKYAKSTISFASQRMASTEWALLSRYLEP